MTKFNMTYCFDIIASYLFLTLAIVSIFVAPILIIFFIILIMMNWAKADKNHLKTIKVLSKTLIIIFVLDLMIFSYIWSNIGRFY